MKWGILGLIILGAAPCMAQETDEQLLTTENKSCAIHYLTPKAKKLWTIEVDESYCQKGFVQGFTTVLIKDSLGRTAQELKGYFHQGYWLSDFPGPIAEFQRGFPQNKAQTLLFKIQSDNDTDFYLATQSTPKEDHYSAFEICTIVPTIMAVHEPATAFGQSAFQTQILSLAQKLVKERCPQAKQWQIIGGTNQILAEGDGPFHANINLTSDETTLSFNSPIPLKEKLHPTELRHESAEPILTIQPEPPHIQSASEEKQEMTPPPFQEISGTPQQTQSAVDLALMAHVLQSPIQGKAVIYIDDTKDGLSITRPLPLKLQTTQPLNKGWHIVMGMFKPQKATTDIHILWAKACLKEWCTDED